MAEPNAEHIHHVTPDGVLRGTFLQLTAAMVATIVAARLPIDGPVMFPQWRGFFESWSTLWAVTNAVALGIAVFKAVQVIRFFMGAQYASGLIRLYVVGGFVGFSLLYILFFDYVARPWEPVRGWEKVPSTAFPRDAKQDGGIAYPVYPGHAE